MWEEKDMGEKSRRDADGPRLHVVVTGHLMDDDTAMDKAQHQQANSREVFHAKQGFLAEFAMAQ